MPPICPPLQLHLKYGILIKTLLTTTEEKMKKRIISALLRATLLFTLAGCGGDSDKPYEKPITLKAKSYNKHDFDLYMQASYGKGLFEELMNSVARKRNFSDDQAKEAFQMFKQMEKRRFEHTIGNLESEYGKAYEISVTVLRTEKHSEDALRQAENWYNEGYMADIKIKEGYEIRCEITITSENGENISRTIVDAYNFEKFGWAVGEDRGGIIQISFD